MFASSLAIYPSRWRHVAYGAGILLLFCSVMLLPLSGWSLWCGSVPMLAACYWLLHQWQLPLAAHQLSLSEQGELRWLGDGLPAGQLLPQSLICHWGIWLYWQDSQQQTRHCWLYLDNFSHEDFRALARHCQLVRWQQRASV